MQSQVRGVNKVINQLRNLIFGEEENRDKKNYDDDYEDKEIMIRERTKTLPDPHKEYKKHSSLKRKISFDENIDDF